MTPLEDQAQEQNVPKRPGVAAGDHRQRMKVLDGWRAWSILLVLACHMLPLGPHAWELNAMAGLAGMALFFTLSGFLITTNLYRDPNVPSFLVRRIFRIVPLAFLGAVIYLVIQGKGLEYVPAHLLFYTNYDRAHLTPMTGHYWSLCVEIQFYFIAALLVALFGRRGLYLLVPLALCVTLDRVRNAAPVSIVTHWRVDEILAGATLGLVWLDALGRPGRAAAWAMRTVPLPIWALAYAVSCHLLSDPAQYAHPSLAAVLYVRPYLAAALVGHTLWAAGRFEEMLKSRPLRYIAEISYALYVIHPLTTHGWLNSGHGIQKYVKRPISFAITFGLAHLSTFAYERRWIALGKRLSQRFQSRQRPEGGVETAVVTAPLPSNLSLSGPIDAARG